MGSAQSTSNQSISPDPWWPIENNNEFTLEQPNILNNINTNTENDNLIDNNQRDNSNINILNNCGSSSGSSECEDNNKKEKIIAAAKKFENYGKTNIAVGLPSTTSVIIATKSSDESLEEFKRELQIKRMARETACNDLRMEINRLRNELHDERELTRKLRLGEKYEDIVKTMEISVQTDTDNWIYEEDMEEFGGTKEKIKNLLTELAETQYSLQLANSENISLTSELNVVRKQVMSLKEVIVCSKQMIEVREEQVTQLKAKIQEIENSLAEREMKLLSEDLRHEYNKQLENIRTLRQLYEDRARVSAAERENLERQISIKKDELAAEIEKTKNFEERIATLENDLQKSIDDMKIKKFECNKNLHENRELKEEMAVINKLFSQTLMGFNGSSCLDIDRLTAMLEENRSLFNEIAVKETNFEDAGLAKLLLDIVKQAHNNDNESKINNDDTKSKDCTDKVNEESLKNFNSTSCDDASLDIEKINKVTSAQEIIGNLPKVWRVLIELLNHHKIEKVEINENGLSEDCYKSVQTPNGPKCELSVSKTYIKLKNLILEKKSLLKETTRLKTLNCHLESRLNNQEKRLSMVSLELTKTWHLVGKMQRQHRQLHTHEQILRYQLQQKRRLLNELKGELEYCRKKWAAAKAKNDESQLECENMRKEFAKRKLQDSNNSAESGYSDGPGSDEDEMAVKQIGSNDDDIEITLPMPMPTYIGKEKSPSPMPITAASTNSGNGAVPKQIQDKLTDEQNDGEVLETDDVQRADRTDRINRLEEQCKSLIAQVLETSNCREKLEVQLCEFQKEIAPAQHPIPLEEFIARKRFTNMSSMLVKNKSSESKKHSKGLTLTEEEYTRRRSERIQRLEDESKSLLNRLSRNTQRGVEMNTKLDALRSRYGNSEDSDGEAVLTEKCSNETPGSSSSDEKSIENRLKIVNDAAIRRSERLKQLENESKQLLTKLSSTSMRGSKMIEHLNVNRKKKDDEIRKREQEKLELKLEEALKTPDAETEIIFREKNIAKTSVEPEKTNEFVLVTQIASQMAQAKGAKPKITEPLTGIAALQLSRSKKKETNTTVVASTGDTESMEEMFLRLSNLPLKNDKENDEKSNQKLNDDNNSKS